MKVVKKMDKKCIEIGKIDKQGYELANRVYHRGGGSPTIRTVEDTIKTIRVWNNGIHRDKTSG